MPGTFPAPPPKPRKRVLRTRLTELALSFAHLLHITFIALDHVNEIGRGTGDVVTDVSLFVGGEEGVRRGSYCSKLKGHVLHLLLLQRKAPGVLWDGLQCLALTRMSRRLL